MMLEGLLISTLGQQWDTILNSVFISNSEDVFLNKAIIRIKYSVPLSYPSILNPSLFFNMFDTQALNNICFTKINLP